MAVVTNLDSLVEEVLSNHPELKGDIGEKGDKGDTGLTGATGPAGVKGRDGATWYSGNGIIAINSIGKNGDFYLDTNTGNIYIKKDGVYEVELNITTDLSGEAIKALYEGEDNTNAYTDSEKLKLSGIEDNATADMTDAQIKVAYENNNDTNAYTDAEKNKLVNIETVSVEYTNKTLDSYTNIVKANAVHSRVKNQTGSTMTKGTVVAYFGYSDTEDAIKVVKANNTTGVAIGILSEDILPYEFGMMVSTGIIDGLNTSPYANGTILYTNDNGGLTDVAPTTGFAQPIAYVLKLNDTIGVLQVLASYPKQDANDVRYDETNSVGSMIDDLITVREV
jgi:hypothetical protein